MGDLRIEERTAVGGDPHGVGHALGFGVLQTVGIGAGGQRRKHFFFEVDHRDDHDARRGEFGAHSLRQRNAVDSRQSDVDHRNVRTLAQNDVEAGYAVGRFSDDRARRFQRRAQARPRQRVILDDDDPRLRRTLRHALGNVIVNVLPRGSRAANVTVPPCFSTMRRTM